jgi:hypothetical protein
VAAAESGIPGGLLVPPAAALGFAAAVGVGAVAPPGAWWALVVLVVGCAVTATIGPARPALVIGVLWALGADGFVVHRLGHLAPVAPGELGWLVAFLGAALLGAWCGLPPALVRRHVDAALGTAGTEARVAGAEGEPVGSRWGPSQPRPGP